MRTALSMLATWHAEGLDCALATIVSTSGSVPRPVGTAIVVSGDGRVCGSISAGCVESDLYHVAFEVMESRIPILRRYAIDEDEVGSIGLMCGGSIEVLVQPAGRDELPGAALFARALESGTSVGRATIVREGVDLGRSMIVTDDIAEGTFGRSSLDAAVVALARSQLDVWAPATRSIVVPGPSENEDTDVLISCFTPPPKFYVFGAIELARPLAEAAKMLGYFVSVCDARKVFATKERFPEADEVVVMRPDQFLRMRTINRSTVICVLTHDPKFDVPVLDVALRSEAAYVGAMGSRRTHEDRLARLRNIGLTDAELERLSSPIGLDLGAVTPAETAISIVAEVIALRRAGTGRRLAELDGPIHAGSTSTLA